MINDLAREIAKAMKEYTDEVKEGIDKEVDSVSKDIIKELKASSPKQGGHYSKDWKEKKVNNKSNAKVIHNKRYYRLTHLLEKGHAKRNGGRVSAIPHIQPIEEKNIKQLEKNIIKIIGGRN